MGSGKYTGGKGVTASYFVISPFSTIVYNSSDVQSFRRRLFQGKGYKYLFNRVQYLFLNFSQHWSEGIHISVVACGERLEESLVMLKSAAIFSKSLLVFHIFAEEELQKGFQEQVGHTTLCHKQQFCSRQLLNHLKKNM